MNRVGTGERAGLAVAAATALWLRLGALGRADLWTDEIQTLRAVELPFGEMVAERLHAGHVPLYFVIEKAWCAFAGTSQAALRAPAAAFGLLAIVPAWSLLRRLGGAAVARWGAVLFALHPLLVELSREARMYSLLLLLALVVADGAAAALEGRRVGAAFFVAAAAGPLVHATWAFALLPLGAWLLARRRRAAAAARAASGAALAAIAVSLVVLGGALAFGDAQTQELTRRPWPVEALVFVTRIFTGSDLTLLRATVPALCTAAVWAVALVAGWRTATPGARSFALLLGVGVPLLSVAVGLVGGLPWGPARYVEMAAVGFLVLAAFGSEGRAAATPARLGGWVLPAAFVLLACLRVLFPDTAWSTAARALRDETVPIVVENESARIVLAHYLGRDVVVGAPPADAVPFVRVALEADRGRRRVTIEPSPPR